MFLGCGSDVCQPLVDRGIDRFEFKQRNVFLVSLLSIPFDMDSSDVVDVLLFVKTSSRNVDNYNN